VQLIFSGWPETKVSQLTYLSETISSNELKSSSESLISKQLGLLLKVITIK
jgi:hypothetical protein